MAAARNRPAKEEAAIAALVSEPTIERAAIKAGISESTIHRWLRDPVFQEMYRQARRSLVQHAVASSQQACAAAVAVLRHIMLSDVSPQARVAAARAILDTALRGVELEDLEARLVTLERRVEEQGSRASS
jgi:hypothetical protein